MAFRLINNRFQDIGVKGFIAVVVISLALNFTGILSLSITLPFIMPFMVIWLVGYSMVNKKSSDQ